MSIALAVMLFFSTTFWWMSSFMTWQTTAPRHWSWPLTNVLVVLSVLGSTATGRYSEATAGGPSLPTCRVCSDCWSSRFCPVAAHA